MLDIVIPIYKEIPSNDDLISIKQAFKILKKHKITFIHPEGLNTSLYQQFENSNFIAFAPEFFENILGYNRLLLDVNFYKKFNRKYILIYQTDALVFHDNIEYWCNKNYDYIGAPWLRSKKNIPIIKLLWDKLNYHIKKILNYNNNKKWQKDKSLLYNNVGNGGLSLRKREKFIDILSSLPHVVSIYNKPCNRNLFYAEDVFFSIEPQRNNIPFSKPNFQEACNFAIENKIKIAMKYNNNILPFGCHRWNKENKKFWMKHVQ